jgi:very-short-patch-repair endonuclease
MSVRKTKEEFIIQSVKLFGKKYDYSQLNYVNNNTKVNLICPIHGAFYVRPNDHLSKKVGCNKCNNASISKSNNVKKNIIERFNIIHNFKYDYSYSEYSRTDSKIKIICPTHGEFLQSPHHHLNGVGCQKCGNVYKKTTEEFIKESKNIHGEKYDYSLVEYKNNRTKVEVICPKHGVFQITPNSHLSKKSGCRECNKGQLEDFLIKSKKIHGDRYDYSQVKYNGNHKTKINIICKNHGSFRQLPVNHMNGIGCPICKLSKGELRIKNYLDENKIKYVRQKKFRECKDKRMLPFDFYLPSENICIEFDGEQHFAIINYYGGTTNFEEIKKRDNIKNYFCEKSGITLIRLNKTNIDKIDELLPTSKI